MSLILEIFSCCSATHFHLLYLCLVLNNEILYYIWLSILWMFLHNWWIYLILYIFVCRAQSNVIQNSFCHFAIIIIFFFFCLLSGPFRFAFCLLYSLPFTLILFIFRKWIWRKCLYSVNSLLPSRNILYNIFYALTKIWAELMIGHERST